MNQPFTTITEAWASLEETVFSDKPVGAREVLRKTFFTGALVMFQITVENGPDDEEEALAQLEKLHAEMRAFTREMKS